ncbi:MAG: IPT/TIG domain-containing protein [Edaphobacter sp.]
MSQSLSKLHGNRPGVMAALFTMLLLIAGCGGSSKTPTPTPTFTPAAGSYSATQSVTVADSTQNAVLYCTNDGSVPTASSPQCANPIKVSQSQTLNVIAIAPGMNPSAVATAQYTIGSTPATPTVTGIGPATGPTTGGTSVTIIGTNFTGVTSVNFGAVAATSFVLNSAGTITATAPAGAVGAVNVTVVTSAGTSATNNADLFTYTVPPTPSITSITPNSGMPGSQVAILGTNFGTSQGTSTVTFNNVSAGAASQWTPTYIVVNVPVGASTGNVVVTVGGVPSAGVPFTVVSSAPTITSLSQTSATAGSQGFTLTINGTNFVSGATAIWSGTALTTTFVNPTQLQAAIPASLIATGGTASITVNDSGGTSSGVTFTINPGVPTITSLSPTSATAGGAAFGLTVTGTNFVSGAAVNWNGQALTTTFLNATQLTAAVPASQITTAGTATITVTDSGGASSGATFTINPGVPTITSISPTSATAGGAGFTLTVNGTNFVSGAAVNWNGTVLSTTLVSSTQLIATVPASLIATAGTETITVTDSGGTSVGTAFTVSPPGTPTITSLSQISATAGGAGFTLTVTGTNFISGATVNWNGTALSTTVESPTELQAAVPASLIATAGTATITVTNSTGTSVGTAFTVNVPAPAITGLSPAIGTPAGGTSVTITGTSFTGATAVNFGSTAAASFTVNSDTSITAVSPAGTGTVDIAVVTPAGTSATVTADQYTFALTISGFVVSGPSGGTPITDAMVQLYAAGTSGYGSAGTPIGSSVSSDHTTGAFSGITYDCSTLTAPGDQLYLTATGNTGVVLMAALGSCSAVSTSISTVTINEATTIASAYALSGFATFSSSGGGVTIGAPATGTSCNAAAGWKSSGPATCNYIGLSNAFATVSNLVDLPSGTALNVTPAYKSNSVAGFNTSIVPQARIHALANALASCANPTTGSGANCGSLFGDATVGTSVPTDTLQAALNIAQHPGTSASQIAGLAAANASFPSALTSTQLSALTDWSLPIIYQGAGIGNTTTQPTGMAIDGAGNIWITAEKPSTLPTGNGTETGGLVAVFSNQGAPLSPSATSASSTAGYMSGIVNPQAIAIDQNGFAWIGNYASQGSTAGSITVLDKTGTPQYGTSTPYTPPLMTIPSQYGIAVDAGNNVWISSNVTGGRGDAACGGTTLSGPWGGSILGLKGSGNAVSGNGIVADYFGDNSSCPTYLAIDGNNNLWTWDNGNTQLINSTSQDVNAISLSLFSTNDGSLTGGPYNNFYPLSGSSNMAIDSSGNGWFLANLVVGGSTAQGIGMMPSIGGFTDQSVLNPAGPLGGSLTDPYNPTVFSNPTSSFGSSLAVDGAGQVWAAGGSPSANSWGLYAINKSDTGLLSPAGGYIGFDGSGLTPIDVRLYNGGTAVDSSGNVWIVSRAVSYPGQISQGGELTEYVGIGVPAPTPLVSGLINGNTPAAKP